MAFIRHLGVIIRELFIILLRTNYQTIRGNALGTSCKLYNTDTYLLYMATTIQAKYA